MKIHVINLARAPERRQKMEQQAETLGLNFSFIEATDGSSLTDQDRLLVDNEQRRRITPYLLSDNEVACWLSHRRAMQNLIDSGELMAVVVEDDAVLTAEFPLVLQAIFDLSSSFDFIDLHRKFKKNEIFIPCRPLLPAFTLGRVGYSHMGAIAYVVSRKGAQKFLASAPRFIHAVDKELHRYWANSLDIYGLENPVAKHDDSGHSYIDETRGQDCPLARPRYPDSEKAYWRLQRQWSRIKDSVQKRLAFRAYVSKGKVEVL